MSRLHLIIYITCACVGLHLSTYAQAQRPFILASFNCENAFDTQHDEGKNDYEYTTGGSRNWNMGRLRHKLDGISKVIAALDPLNPVSMVALCEVENDSVLDYLTSHSSLRALQYDYVMTHSEDHRGVDVAVLYSRFSFGLISYECIRPKYAGSPTRDILHLCGTIADGDTLDVYAVHLPSKLGGKEARTKGNHLAEFISHHIDSVQHIRPSTRIIVMGDFNSEYKSSLLRSAFNAGLYWSEATRNASSLYDVIVEKVPKGRGTYKYRGNWSVIDHILVSGNVDVEDAGIFDSPFLLEDDLKFGGKKPRRTYDGFKYKGGISDHLPVWIRIK